MSTNACATSCPGPLRAWLRAMAVLALAGATLAGCDGPVAPAPTPTPAPTTARAYFAFGLATEPSDVPVSGTMTCFFGMDEIGDGELTLDLAAGTLSPRRQAQTVRG